MNNNIPFMYPYNDFLNDDIDVIDIKYSVSSSIYSEEQIFCFSAMIIYN